MGDCKWKPWSSWSACKSGKKTRTRSKDAAQNGGKQCSGPREETKNCNSAPKVDCKWGKWSEWSCNKDSGNRKRTRTRTQRAQNGGEECEGENIQRKPCDVDCTWNKWSAWSACKKKEKFRTRTKKHRQRNNGASCSGPA